MVNYNFRDIHAVPNAKEFVDIVLSRTQRKTPTIVHKRLPIGAIREFYMRKVKFTGATIKERITNILTQFPQLDDIHPFYADLINVLYDRDHYKLALGQLNIARHLVENLTKDYEKLLKYGDSLFRCKELKKAALGRMMSVLLRNKGALAYLEEVRQHLSRLPSINPNTRTILLTGFPNVGKSSFINKITRANVDVQPYAFTTQSLFVGHMDYKDLRWQVIDSPGVLDRPLEDRNTIEMQAITALAHLHCCILFLLDLSLECQYSIKQQVDLFKSLKSVFANKPLILVANKVDRRKISDLDEDERADIEALSKDAQVQVIEMSNKTEEGCMSVKATACDILLRQRVDMKMKSRKLDGVLNRMQITLPSKRDTKTRISSIPASVLAARQRKKAEKEGALTSDTKNADSMETEEDVPTRKLLRDIEREQGGVGVFHFDLRKHWRLSDDAATNASWQTHDAPEIYLGKNVADFYAEDIADRLEALEREEEELIAQTEMEMDSSEGHALTPEQQALWQKISDKKKVIMQSSRVSKSRNKPRITSRTRERDHDNMTEHLVELGLPGVDEEKTRGRKRKRVSLSRGGDGMDVDGEEGARSRSKSHAPRDKTPHESGFRDKRQKLEAKKLMKKSAKLMNRRGMQGVADRFIGTKMPKHLFSGKRGIGKTDWR